MVLLLSGCASPGPPRAPSLQLPAVVSDLAATRRADEVELQFAVPALTSDGMAYRGASLRATVCRAVEAGTCVPLPALTGIGFPAGGAAQANRTTLHDALPPALATGPVRLLTYRVELSNPAGRTAGFGDAAYAGAGAAPVPVAGLRAEGSREGVVLRWQPEAGTAGGPGGSRGADQGSDVVLRRELVSGSAAVAPAKGTKNSRNPGSSKSSSTKVGETGSNAGLVWLSTAPLGDPLHANDPSLQEARTPSETVGTASANGVLDDSAAMDSTYRYAAERQRRAQLGGHTLLLHSGLSAPVEVALRAVYPPPAPTDLVGTVFPLAPVDDPASEGTQAGGLAVDLIWTPAEDAASPGHATAGYLVYREMLDERGVVVGARVSLTPAPVRMPAFHDVLPRGLGNSANAQGSQRLRYGVIAVDAAGLQSTAVTTVVETSGQ